MFLSLILCLLLLVTILSILWSQQLLSIFLWNMSNFLLVCFLSILTSKVEWQMTRSSIIVIMLLKLEIDLLFRPGSRCRLDLRTQVFRKKHSNFHYMWCRSRVQGYCSYKFERKLGIMITVGSRRIEDRHIPRLMFLWNDCISW